MKLYDTIITERIKKYNIFMKLYETFNRGVTMTTKTLGRKIKLIRQDLGYTMEEFGKLFNANKSIVSKWEKGTTFPSPDRIKKISEISGISTMNLLFDSPEDFLYFRFNYEAPFEVQGKLNKDGIYYIYYSVIESYAEENGIEDIQKHDFLSNDTKDLVKAVTMDGKTLTMWKLNILKTILKTISKTDDKTIKQLLPKELASSLIKNKENIDQIENAEILNNGFAIEAIEPYNIYQMKNVQSAYKKSIDLMELYSKMCEGIKDNNFDADVEIANTFIIKNLADDIIKSLQEENTHLTDPLINFAKDIMNNKNEDLREYYQMEKDKQNR